MPGAVCQGILPAGTGKASSVRSKHAEQSVAVWWVELETTLQLKGC